MGRKRIIKDAIKTIRHKRENVINYLNKHGNNVSYDLCDIELQHYIHNIMVATKMSGYSPRLSSRDFIIQYISAECIMPDILSPKELDFKTIYVNLHKYYKFLIDDYENIIAKFQSEITKSKNKLTVSEIIALISSISGAIVSILTAISHFS